MWDFFAETGLSVGAKMEPSCGFQEEKWSYAIPGGRGVDFKWGRWSWSSQHLDAETLLSVGIILCHGVAGRRITVYSVINIWVFSLCLTEKMDCCLSPRQIFSELSDTCCI